METTQLINLLATPTAEHMVRKAAESLDNYAAKLHNAARAFDRSLEMMATGYVHNESHPGAAVVQAGAEMDATMNMLRQFFMIELTGEAAKQEVNAFLLELQSAAVAKATGKSERGAESLAWERCYTSRD